MSECRDDSFARRSVKVWNYLPLSSAIDVPSDVEGLNINGCAPIFNGLKKGWQAKKKNYIGQPLNVTRVFLKQYYYMFFIKKFLAIFNHESDPEKCC